MSEVQMRISGVGTVQLIGSALLIHPYLLGGTSVGGPWGRLV